LLLVQAAAPRAREEVGEPRERSPPVALEVGREVSLPARLGVERARRDLARRPVERPRARSVEGGRERGEVDGARVRAAAHEADRRLIALALARDDDRRRDPVLLEERPVRVLDERLERALLEEELPQRAAVLAVIPAVVEDEPEARAGL